jgi:hypothetical protein
VEAHHGIEIGTRARHVEDDLTAEAVADCRDLLRVDVRVLFELRQRRLESRRDHRGILRRRVHERPGRFAA